MLDNQENTAFVQHIFNIVKQSRTELATALGVSEQEIEKLWAEELEDLEITSRRYFQGRPILNEKESLELEEAFHEHRQIKQNQQVFIEPKELSEAPEMDSSELRDLEKLVSPRIDMAPQPLKPQQEILDKVLKLFMHPNADFTQVAYAPEASRNFGNEPVDLVLFHKTPPFYVLIRLHSEPIDSQAPKQLQTVLEYYHAEVNTARTLSPVGIILGKHRQEWVIGYIYQSGMKSIIERYLPSKEVLKEIIENMG